MMWDPVGVRGMAQERNKGMVNCRLMSNAEGLDPVSPFVIAYVSLAVPAVSVGPQLAVLRRRAIRAGCKKWFPNLHIYA